jgi:hypothetical protein
MKKNICVNVIHATKVSSTIQNKTMKKIKLFIT